VVLILSLGSPAVLRFWHKQPSGEPHSSTAHTGPPHLTNPCTLHPAGISKQHCEVCKVKFACTPAWWFQPAVASPVASGAGASLTLAIIISALACAAQMLVGVPASCYLI